MDEYFCKGQKRTLIFNFGYAYTNDFKENYIKNGLFKFNLNIPDLTFLHYGGNSFPSVYLTNNKEKPVPFLNVSPPYITEKSSNFTTRYGHICFHDFHFLNAKQVANAFFNSSFSFSMNDNGLRKYIIDPLESHYNTVKFLKSWEADDNYLKQFGIQ